MMAAKRSKNRKKDIAEKWETLIGWSSEGEMPDNNGIESWSKRRRDKDSRTECERRLASRDWEKYLCTLLRKCAAIENAAKFYDQSLSDALRPRQKAVQGPAGDSDTQQGQGAGGNGESEKTKGDQDTNNVLLGKDRAQSPNHVRPQTAVVNPLVLQQESLKRSKSCFSINKTNPSSATSTQRVQKSTQSSMHVSNDHSKSSSRGVNDLHLNETVETSTTSAIQASRCSVSVVSLMDSRTCTDSEEPVDNHIPRLYYTRSQTWQNSSIVSRSTDPKMSSVMSPHTPPGGVTGSPSGTFVTALNELRLKMASSSDSQVAALAQRIPQPSRITIPHQDGTSASSSMPAPLLQRANGSHQDEQGPGKQKLLEDAEIHHGPLEEQPSPERSTASAGVPKTGSGRPSDSEAHVQSAPANSIRERTESLRQNALINLKLALQTAKRYDCQPSNIASSNQENNEEEKVYSLHGAQQRLNGSTMPLRELLDLPPVDNVQNGITGKKRATKDIASHGASGATYENNLLTMKNGIELLRFGETRQQSRLGPPAFRPQQTKTALQRAKETTQKRMHGQLSVSGQAEEDANRIRWQSSAGNLYAPGSATSRGAKEADEITNGLANARLSRRRRAASYACGTLPGTNDSYVPLSNQDHHTHRFNAKVMDMARRAALGSDLRQGSDVIDR